MQSFDLFKYPEKYYLLILLSLGAAFFLPFLGYLHLFDWDELNFAESSREMLVSGDYFHVQINYVPFWEKPPLFMWLQSFCMSIFGVNEFAARLPNALFGLVTLFSIFKIGSKFSNPKFAFIWGLLYMMSFLPHIYFKSGIIDPVFNYFIFISIYYLVLTVNQQLVKYALLCGVFAGLAFLTKGPVAFLLIGLTYLIYWGLHNFKRGGHFAHLLIIGASALAVSFVWILPEFIQNGSKTLVDFVVYQIRLFRTPDAGHAQPFFYHFLVVFIGCFPMSLFALPLFRPGKFQFTFDFSKWMAILFWVVMIVFSLAKTKIVHYSSMCWLPMSFCAALVIYWYITDSLPVSRLSKNIFLAGGIVLSIILTIVPVVGFFRKALIPLIKDPFAVASLDQDVDWQFWYVGIGLVFLAGIIISYRYIRKDNFTAFLSLQVINTGVVLFVYLLLVVPKIEQHSQGAAINIYKSLAGKDVYVHTLGFKSYAHLFYFKVQPSSNPSRLNEEYLISGAIDKPVYFVTKITNTALDEYQDRGIRFIREEGGFKLYLREP